MIGKICKAITPFYDFKSHKMKNKSRPALVLAKADNEDYVVIPISKVSHSENIDSYYDVKIDPLNYPNTKLTQILNITVRRSRQSGVARATCPD